LVRVNIRIESFSVNDPYVRNHAKGIDQPLDDTGHWDQTQPEKFLGVAAGSFSHEQTVDLPAGTHYVEYAASGYVPDYRWHARIYVNGELKAEGDVGRLTHLRASFTVAAPPIPAPPIPLTQIFMIALPIILGFGLTLTPE